MEELGIWRWSTKSSHAKNKDYGFLRTWKRRIWMGQSEPLCLPLGVQIQTPTRRHGASDVEWDLGSLLVRGLTAFRMMSQNQAHHFLKPKTLFMTPTGLISCMPCYGWMPWPYPPCIHASMSCHATLASRNGQASYSFES